MKKTLIILLGPSGAGKSSFVDKLVDELPYLEDTKTFTTRLPRQGESEGNPYHFVSEEQFDKHISEGFFVEWAQVHDNKYGTPHYQITKAWERNKTVIMDVDVQGAKTFKQKYPEALCIFIQPPSIDVLRQRVMERDSGRTPNLELRMENAIREMDLAEEFDRILINEDFTQAYAQIKKMIEDFINQ